MPPGRYGVGGCFLLSPAFSRGPYNAQEVTWPWWEDWVETGVRHHKTPFSETGAQRAAAYGL